MVLVTGGVCQGKLDYAFTLLGRECARELFADGLADGYETAFERPVVYRFQEYVRRLLTEGKPVEDFVDRLLRAPGVTCVVTTEIGCGVVPMEAFDRIWREQTGRACQRLAREALEVHRVLCGIGSRIK